MGRTGMILGTSAKCLQLVSVSILKLFGGWLIFYSKTCKRISPKRCPEKKSHSQNSDPRCVSLRMKFGKSDSPYVVFLEDRLPGWRIRAKITIVFVPNFVGLWDPFQMAFDGLLMGVTNHLATGSNQYTLYSFILVCSHRICCFPLPLAFFGEWSIPKLCWHMYLPTQCNPPKR